MADSIESKEFVQWRTDQYRAAAIGVEPVRVDREELEAENGTTGRCICCQQWRKLFGSICRECIEEAEDL